MASGVSEPACTLSLFLPQSEPLQPLASGSFSTRTAAAAALSHAPQSCERIVLADDSAARRPKGEKSRGLPCVPANQQVRG